MNQQALADQPGLQRSCFVGMEAVKEPPVLQRSLLRLRPWADFRRTCRNRRADETGISRFCQETQVRSHGQEGAFHEKMLSDRRIIMAADRRRAVFPIILLQSREPHRAEEHMRKTADRRMSRRDGGGGPFVLHAQRDPRTVEAVPGGEELGVPEHAGSLSFPARPAVCFFVSPAVRLFCIDGLISGGKDRLAASGRAAAKAAQPHEPAFVRARKILQRC